MQQPSTFRLIWDADSDRSVFDDQVRCLWCAGEWTNRSELARQADLADFRDEAGLLAALHVRWAESLPRRVHGCLSWVIWDGPRRELSLVADRMGLQGLFWRRTDRRIEVSSRIEALLPALPKTDLVNEASVVSHLRGSAPLEGETFFAGIHSVAPGGVLSLSENGFRQTRYWRPELGPRASPAEERDCAVRLWSLLVRLAGEYASAGQGVALSGGLDSTALAAALRASGQAPGLTAFVGVSPQVPESDESEAARAVARHLGLDWTEIRSDLQPPLRDGLQTAKDSPHFFYYTEFWEALLEQARERGVATLHTGGGGDHLFGGVSGYPDLLLTGRWVRLGRQLARHARLAGSGWSFLLRRKLLGPTLYAYLPWWRRRCLPAPAWLGPSLRKLDREICQKADVLRLALPGRVHRLRALDIGRIGQFCQDLDRRGRGRGVRLSHPLLDHRLVEFALSLPAWEFSQGGWDKMVLRRAVQGRLPAQVTAARSKVVPGAILRQAIARRRDDLIEDLLTSMRGADLGWVAPGELRRAVDGFRDGSSDDSTFWFALTLEDWLRRHF